MNAWMQWDRETPAWLRYLWWSCFGGGLGMVAGVVWAFLAAAADRTEEWEMHLLAGSLIGGCIGALIGIGCGLLVAWLRRPRRS